jgi:hypothetical protein
VSDAVADLQRFCRWQSLPLAIAALPNIALFILIQTKSTKRRGHASAILPQSETYLEMVVNLASHVLRAAKDAVSRRVILMPGVEIPSVSENVRGALWIVLLCGIYMYMGPYFCGALMSMDGGLLHFGPACVVITVEVLTVCTIMLADCAVHAAINAVLFIVLFCFEVLPQSIKAAS